MSVNQYALFLLSSARSQVRSSGKYAAGRGAFLVKKTARYSPGNSAGRRIFQAGGVLGLLLSCEAVGLRVRLDTMAPKPLWVRKFFAALVAASLPVTSLGPAL